MLFFVVRNEGNESQQKYEAKVNFGKKKGAIDFIRIQE